MSFRRKEQRWLRFGLHIEVKEKRGQRAVGNHKRRREEITESKELGTGEEKELASAVLGWGWQIQSV